MSDKDKLVEVEIPWFPGFYESELSDLVDRELEYMFDYEGDGFSKMPEDFWKEVDYDTTFRNIAKIWLEGYQCWLKGEHELDTPLAWSTMTSPKEYNFTTDRIFAHVKLNDMAAAFRKVGTKSVRLAAEERFTSYDGFMSFYDSDIRTWGKLSTWDHNQLGTIFYALGNPGELMYDANCNGGISNAVVLTEKGRKIADDFYHDRRALEEWNLLAK